jgi:hypothetical protein
VCESEREGVLGCERVSDVCVRVHEAV